jgi:hypothetical protein
MAEVQLLQGRYAEAGSLYTAAVVAAPNDVGSHESTLKQAKLILEHLNATGEQRSAVLSAFQHLSSAGAAGGS